MSEPHHLDPVNKSRVARLAHHILSHADGRNGIRPQGGLITFDMDNHAMSYNGYQLDPAEVRKCGSSCCFLGYAPFVFPETRKMPCWSDVSYWILGGCRGSNMLFSVQWPDNVKHAACRALYLLKHGIFHDMPGTIGDVTGGMMGKNKETILAELETYFEREPDT